MHDEIWKDIPGYEGEYAISNYGRVKSYDRYVIDKIGRKRFHKGKIKKIFQNPETGYLQTSLTRHHISKTIYIHKYVCLLFVSEKPGIKYTVNHKDGNKLNCYYKNLEWLTFKDNTKHSYDVLNRPRQGGPGIAEPLIVIRDNEIIYCKSMKELSKIFNISETHAWRIVDTGKIFQKGMFKIYHAKNYEKCRGHF